MKTIEELEAELETVTRERDLSLSAWESAGMQGRTAQSAMLELTRQLEEAQERIELLTELREEERSLNAHFHHEIQAKHTAAEQAKRERDEARAEMELFKDGCERQTLRGIEMRGEIEDLKRERDEARETILALTTAKAEADLEIATLTAALDERDVEAERGLERYDRLMRERDEARAESAKWKAGFEEFRSRNTDLMMHLFEAQEKVRAVNIEPMLHLNAQLRSKVHGLSAEVERLMHQLADQTNETTRVRLEAKREIEALTDERDELLVRVANADAELRATREAYTRSHVILKAIHGALTDALPSTPIPALDSFDVVELVRALAKGVKP